MGKLKEKCMQILFALTACVSVVSVGLICIFLFVNGIPAIKKVGVVKFLTGITWRPSNQIFGILPMIMGSIYVTIGAVMIGVPVGILTAVFMAGFCPPGLYKVLKPCIGVMAGIPSVIYGFFGLSVLVPLTRKIFGGDGNSILTASLVLGIMILPTIAEVSETSIRAVPKEYYQGSLALGATHERSIFLTVIPAAQSGILAGVILGVGRAIGETMAVIMVAGNQPRMPKGILAGVRTLTANIVQEMGYAQGLHREVLVATGVILFVFILAINIILFVFAKTKRDA